MQLIVKYFLSFILFNFSFLLTTAQWYDPEKVNKKAGEIYESAYEDAQAGKYPNAIIKLNDALKIEPRFVDAYLSRAGIYANLKNYSFSVTDFESGLKLDSIYASSYLLPYSISLAGIGKFTEALKAVANFLQNKKLNEQSIKAATYRKKTYEFAVAQQNKIKDNRYLFSPINLGDSINSKSLEYFPSLSIDGKKIVFTRRENNDEDFYESALQNDKWSAAKLLQGKVNTNLNEGAQNISQDGQLLVFTGCNYTGGQGSCDLYFSLKTKNGWSEPQNLGPTVNTDFWESSPSISPDKRAIYFASGRAGGFGGRDIWVTHLLPNGKWGNVENLGEAVNTIGDESCPFIHADNETLYFNSNGHQGYGMTDLFLSKKVSDSTWTVAQNLGYPINTIDDEGSLIVAADAKTAYYASDNYNSKGGLDIFSFTLRNDIKPTKTLWVKGKVFDKKSLQGLPSAVELIDIVSKKIINKIKTDEEGNYLATLPIGKNYLFNVTRKGYLFYNENFSLVTITDSVFTKDIPLQPIETGATIVLNNIFFDSKLFVLKPTSIIELDKVVQLLTDNPKLKIQISGHTDNIGKPKDNILLSNNRAKAVTNYLLQRGILATRVIAKGFGSTKPLADNKTELGKGMNRRTELSVVSN